MKKFAGILLMLCLAVPFFGTYAWLKYHTRLVRREVKRRMMEGMEKDELAQLVFSKNEADNKLHWKDSKEFEFNGQMYDVVSDEETNDSIRYWCLPDDKETLLNKQLDNLVAHLLGNMPDKRETQRQLNNFLANLYHSEIPRWRFFPFLKDEINRSAFNYRYASVFHSPPAPPPEIA